MLQYVLTGLAGVALGITAIRISQSLNAQSARDADQTGGDASDGAQGQKQPPRPRRKLLIGAGALLAIAIAVLVFRRDASETGLPASLPGNNTAQLDDVQTMISRLAERLEKNPNDGEGFRMLGWSYVMTGKPEQAITPYKQALRLLPDNALVLAGYGEALVGVAGGKVTDEARGLFGKALKLDPTEPRSRHFEALWLAQNGQEKQALEKWIALANSGPADAQWQADVLRRINETAQKLGVSVAGRIKAPQSAENAGVMPPVGPAAMQSAGAMPEGDRQAMIDGMVNRLAAKLKADPKNPEGWARLLRSRMVLGQGDQAARDLAAARKALARDPAGLAQVDAAAREAGVPGA